jgi:hypothetical protein
MELSSQDEVNSSLFITTRPSEYIKTRSFLSKESRNFQACSQGISNPSPICVAITDIDKTYSSGSEIIVPPERSLKGFLKTYFKGKKKGEYIFDKIVRKRTNYPQLGHIRVKSQGLENAKHRRFPSNVYS